MSTRKEIDVSVHNLHYLLVCEYLGSRLLSLVFSFLPSISLSMPSSLLSASDRVQHQAHHRAV